MSIAFNDLRNNYTTFGDVPAAVSEILFPTSVIYTAARTGPCSAASADATATSLSDSEVPAVTATSAG